MTIDLDPPHLAQVVAILKQHVPGVEVWAFGSRVTGTARRFSDLDLEIRADAALAPATLEGLRDAFSMSDLPFLVDLVDWHELPKPFRAIVENANVSIGQLDD